MWRAGDADDAGLVAGHVSDYRVIRSAWAVRSASGYPLDVRCFVVFVVRQVVFNDFMFFEADGFGNESSGTRTSSCTSCLSVGAQGRH